MADIATMARDFSLWLNGTYPTDVSEEAVHWRRVLKVCEEAGEVRAALGAYLHENPRKPAGSLDDVISELADCVGAALGAIEHLTGHEGRSLAIATERVRYVCERVGVATQGTRGGPAMTAPVPQAAVDIERLCEVMHDAYEAAATEAGWETQQVSRKPWADVPEANKATMRVAVAAVVAAVQGPIKAEGVRESADEWQRGAGLTVMLPRVVGVPAIDYAQRTLDWLLARADRIEAQP